MSQEIARRAVIVGAGGIGLTVGKKLADTGVAVTFVESDEAKLDRARRSGQRFLHPDDWTPSADAIVFLCVKCYDNASLLPRLAGLSNLIPIQNGFDPALDARSHPYEGIASFVARCEPGTIEAKVTRRGHLHFGRRTGQHGRLSELHWLLKSLGRSREFQVQLVESIEPIKHTKLMYNSAISPLAAAAGMDNGELLSIPAARQLFFALILENYHILMTAGCPLGIVGPFHPRTVARILRRPWLARLFARAFEPSLRGTYCSMAGEIQTGRTELDNYTGHLLRLADKHGLAAPVNRKLYWVIKSMEQERAMPRRDLLDELSG